MGISIIDNPHRLQDPLPAFNHVAYKAKNIYTTGIVGGPNGARYNRCSSGGLDVISFPDWVLKIVISAPNIYQKKYLIGDNLSSDFSSSLVFVCEENNISLTFSQLTLPI